ncbi:riboflavin synthase [Coxiella endosymbiont of Ornithodoros amblus]|uniref:riboflavin synthase n=1 Tax=Coxiella endosymbiont of Ornithodoros amblus TaxID=1656166 RepID=UPI00244DF45D|nr:riboflavin synthase [Coxiella endosymbiont of Ornithodoros amblus]MBW5802297.1 riboflavin synthase [Coxiella endosymbiont of Ornithodoros amblus]
MRRIRLFTGIIDHCGEIRSIEALPDHTVLSVDTQFSDFRLGESIAIDGVCVTVTQKKLGSFSCDLSPETLACTKARDYKIGGRINLERALRLTDRMGGHFVSGHVDQTGILESQKKHAEFIQMDFKNSLGEWWNYLIPKGSVAVNGVSLTVNSVADDCFSVMLIPHTLERTNLSDLKEGQIVNIEFDLITKIIVQKKREALSHAKTI